MSNKILLVSIKSLVSNKQFKNVCIHSYFVEQSTGFNTIYYFKLHLYYNLFYFATFNNDPTISNDFK